MAFGNFCFRFTSTTLKNFSYDSVMTTKIPKFLLNPVSFRARRIIFQVKSVKKYSKITAVLWSLKKIISPLEDIFSVALQSTTRYNILEKPQANQFLAVIKQIPIWVKREKK